MIYRALKPFYKTKQETTASLGLRSTQIPTTTSRRPTINDQHLHYVATNVRHVHTAIDVLHDTHLQRHSKCLRRQRNCLKTALFRNNYHLPPSHTDAFLSLPAPGSPPLYSHLYEQVLGRRNMLLLYCTTLRNVPMYHVLGKGPVGQVWTTCRRSRISKCRKVTHHVQNCNCDKNKGQYYRKNLQNLSHRVFIYKAVLGTLFQNIYGTFINHCTNNLQNIKLLILIILQSKTLSEKIKKF